MKSNILRHKKLGLMILPVAALAVALLVMNMGQQFTNKAHADFPHTGTDFGLSQGSCVVSGANGTGKCTVPLNTTFVVGVDIIATGSPAMNYQGYDSVIDYTAGLSPVLDKTTIDAVSGNPVPNSSSVAQVPCLADDGGTPGPGTNCIAGALIDHPGLAVWNKCSTPTGLVDVVGAPVGFTRKGAGCAGTSSAFLGHLYLVNMKCNVAGQTQTLRLVHGAGFTDLVGTAANPGAHGEAAGTFDTMSINCVAATSTFTPTPTATPPPIPKVQKTCTSVNVTGPSTLCNVFLHRQGLKIPPTTCLSSTDVATLTEAINIPISSINPKGDLQTLAAFEFEVRYDAKNVCVELAPTANWSSDASVICTVRDDTNSTLKGIAQIGCVTSGKAHKPVGLTIATIKVHASPELYSQIRPNQDNGIAVQILNQGCNLADEQGHAIPVFSCEDADLTFRYLEGDVDGPDCVVGVFDTQNVAFRWGVHKGSLLYNSFLDLEPSGQVKGNGAIDIKDVQFVFGRFNSTCAHPWPAQLPVNPKR